jgi:acyl-CoA thioester hydrolase
VSPILTLPTDGRPLHHTFIEVRLVETDFMSFVHHSNYLVYFELARIDFLQKQGISYAELVKSGTHFPVVESSLRYHQPAFFSDKLDIETWVGAAGRVSLDFCSRVFRLQESDRLLLTEGVVTVACINNDRKLQRVPDSLCEAVGFPRVKRN